MSGKEVTHARWTADEWGSGKEAAHHNKEAAKGQANPHPAGKTLAGLGC